MKGCGMLLFLVVTITLPFALLAWIIFKMVKGVKNRATGFRDTVVRGETADALVTKVVGGGTMAGDSASPTTRRFVCYRFEVPGKGTFEGEISDRELKVGDSLKIVFDPQDPAQNWPESIVEKGLANAPQGMIESLRDSEQEKQRG